MIGEAVAWDDPDVERLTTDQQTEIRALRRQARAGPAALGRGSYRVEPVAGPDV